ncbi:hypothetical protein AAF712_009123 [Marasmius tenuissimus]|uniref:SAP domain-containing protein n=1 Tax=Marasmius tenuissimus TaxID=585030 RepID=A0ABR2ZT50_9AGAR
MPREDFIREYLGVRESTFKTTTIQAAWARSGAHPFNPKVFHDTDYAPSLATSYNNADVPSTFPLPSFYDDSEVPNGNHTCEGCEDDPDIDPVSSPQLSPPISVAALPAVSIVADLPPSASSQSTPTDNSDPLPPPAVAYKSNVPCAQYRDDSQYIGALEDEVDALRKENAKIGAHCVILHDQYTVLKRKYNKANTKKSKKRKLNVEARHLTSDEFMMQKEKENRERAAEEQRKDFERQHQRETCDQSAPFLGSLKSKNKEDLKDVAYRLGLPMDGTNNELIARIESHFTANPALHENPVFVGLFNSRHGQTMATSASASISSSTDPGPSALPSDPQPVSPLGDATHFNAHAQITATPSHSNHIPLSCESYRPPGPSSYHIPPGYIAHVPSYYRPSANL